MGGIGNFLAKLAKGLGAAAPDIQQIGNEIVSAAGSPQQQSELNTQNELALRRQQLGTQQQLAQSTLQSQDLARKLEQKQLENVRTPEQQAASDIATKRAELENTRLAAPPADLIGPVSGGGYGHFERKYLGNGQYQVSPTMVSTTEPNPTQAAGAGMVPPIGGQPLVKPNTNVTGRSQLMAMQKPSGAGMIVPDATSPTGFSKELYDSLGNVVARIPNALPSPGFLPSTTSGSTTTLKQDANGNWVAVNEPH